MAFDPSRELAKALYKPTPIRQDRSFEASIERLGNVIEKQRMYKKNELNDRFSLLQEMLKITDSSVGLEKINSEITNFSIDANKNALNELQGEFLSNIHGQKKKMIEDFETGIIKGSEFINTTQFLDTADEFQNIQSTIDSKNKELKKQGKTTHASVADFLQSEISNANLIRDNISAGFVIDKDGKIVNQRMRYNKAESKDKDVYRKITKYLDRLQLATMSLAGDQVISPEEAQAILIGDKSNYEQEKRTAINKAIDNYKYNRNKIVEYDKLINSANQKRLNADDLFMTQEDQSTADFMKLSNDYSKADWTSILSHLNDMKGEFTRARNAADINFKTWYGSYFQDKKPGMNLDDINQYDIDDNIITGDQEEEKDVITEKEKVKAQDDQKTASNTLITGDEFTEFTPPRKNQDSKEIATALGEKNYTDVKKKYLSSDNWYGKYAATNVKRDTANSSLNAILDKNNLTVSKVVNYIANNNSRELEREFQKFLKKNNVDKKARDILATFAESTYKLQKNPISALMSSFDPRAVGGRPKWGLTSGTPEKPSPKQAYTTKGYKKGNVEKIKKSIKNYQTVGEFEALILLYEFMGTKGI